MITNIEERKLVHKFEAKLRLYKHSRCTDHLSTYKRLNPDLYNRYLADIHAMKESLKRYYAFRHFEL